MDFRFREEVLDFVGNGVMEIRLVCRYEERDGVN